MAIEAEELLAQAVASGSLDEQKGRAALLLYKRMREMGAVFTFGDFLVERGLLAQMAVDAFESHEGAEFSTVDTLGDFELLELLGEGENGAVYRALQKSLNREVALKILNTELARDAASVERFLCEARAVAKLNHAHVVQGISAGSEHGLHYFAMELLDGGSVRELLEQSGGRLEERRALELVKQAALGLQAAHAAGILHRDVKPDNLLLNKDGVAKLTDLGIAQAAAGHVGSDGGTFWGSPPYVAPEIIAGTVQNDVRSDIYSLGATLFELLTGAPPFLADDPGEILRMHLDEQPADVKALRPELHPRTAALVRLMLAKRPEERARAAHVISDAAGKIIEALDAQYELAPAAPAKPVQKSVHVPPHRTVGAPRKKMTPLRIVQPVPQKGARPLPSRPGATRPVTGNSGGHSGAARPGAARPNPARPGAKPAARPGAHPRRPR